MSNLLNVSLRATFNVFKGNSYRLLPKTFFSSALPNTIGEAIRSTKSWFSIRQNCTRPYELNTNVAKDVVLFKYENPRYFNMLNFFAICQFVFWNYLSHFAFTTLKDAPVEVKPDSELKWYQRINLGDNKYRNAITIFCFLIGYGIMAAAWLFTLRSVRFLILRKGGKEVSLVTYGPFNRNRIMNVPLKFISAQESRSTAKSQLPLKVKNRTLFYVLDIRGEFRNTQLFDYTVGMKRRLDI